MDEKRVAKNEARIRESTARGAHLQPLIERGEGQGRALRTGRARRRRKESTTLKHSSGAQQGEEGGDPRSTSDAREKRAKEPERKRPQARLKKENCASREKQRLA